MAAERNEEKERSQGGCQDLGPERLAWPSYHTVRWGNGRDLGLGDRGILGNPVINNKTHAACLSSKGIEQHSERLQESPSARPGGPARCSRQVPGPRRPKSTLTPGTGSSASAARSPGCHSPEKNINKYTIPYVPASHFPLRIRTTWWAEPGPRPQRSRAAGAGF